MSTFGSRMSLIRAVGLLPFAFIPGVVPAIVFTNGMLLHGERYFRGTKSKRYKFLCVYDICTNVILSTYANINTKYQPQTACTSLFCIFSFYHSYGKNNPFWAFWHVFSVQWPLAFCCYMNTYTN